MGDAHDALGECWTGKKTYQAKLREMAGESKVTTARTAALLRVFDTHAPPTYIAAWFPPDDML